MKIRNQKGFTLIELLIVVAIIGIIAAIAIPNLLNAIDRGKQKRTMADMRSIGTAAESYAIDVNVYPSTSGIANLATDVEPLYIKILPQADGWKNGFVYEVDDGVGSEYTVISYAKDGADTGFVGGQTNEFIDDIYFVNGQFTQWPEGVQQ
jgi:general secretion pathway protein G